MCQRLRKIDELERPDHTFLTLEDECYYLMEYTAHRGYMHSSANDLISNLKKSANKKGTSEWKYKTWAIQKVIGYFRDIFSEEFLADKTLVPVPPSKSKNDPLHDGRMCQILQGLGKELDIRELIIQRESREAAHQSTVRPTVEELKSNYDIDTKLILPKPSSILLFDDVLTTGTHYKACQQTLKEQFPEIEIKGIFVARRAIE